MQGHWFECLVYFQDGARGMIISKMIYLGHNLSDVRYGVLLQKSSLWVCIECMWQPSLHVLNRAVFLFGFKRPITQCSTLGFLTAWMQQCLFETYLKTFHTLFTSEESSEHVMRNTWRVSFGNSSNYSTFFFCSVLFRYVSLYFTTACGSCSTAVCCSISKQICCLLHENRKDFFKRNI